MTKRKTVATISSYKGREKLVMLTAYTAPVARLLDPHVDMLLVGDSMGMVVYGMSTTRGVTVDTMINHGRTVVNSSSNALVVVDMPFGSYEESPAQALETAERIMNETGADAVKLEGGVAMEATIAHIVKHNIPVMGHIGLLPQHVTEASGFRMKGKTDEEAAQIIEDARAVERAGAFAMVIEATKSDLSRRITEMVAIPTIGIGASVDCDGQVLVIDDVLGLSERAPGFAKQYANISKAIEQAAIDYADDVRGRKFPLSKAS